MARMHRTSVWLVLVLAALLARPAPAAVVRQDVAALTAQARQIIIGDVVDVSSFWDDHRTLIKSRTTVQVAQYLVGDGPGREVLEMSGGTVGDATLYVSVLPRFEVGERVLLFLGEREMRLVGCFQGAFLTDGNLVVQVAPACQHIIPDTYRPLRDLLAEIQRALPPGVTLPDLQPYQGDFHLPLDESRYAFCGADWTYKANPMGENYKINANCGDASAGDASSQIAQIQNGAAAWNGAGADFVFTYGGTSSQTSISYNGTNLIYFDTTPPDGGGYIAATYYWSLGGDMLECDMVFNDAEFTWWNGSGSCGGNKMDIWDIATHELGHFLCLADLYGDGDVDKTMYGYSDYCETYKRTLHSDDINGIKAIYGSASDTTPPTPNPMTWATPPYPTSTAAIAMIATTATDSQSPPVQYFFDFVSGGLGGTDSAWQLGTSYADSGLVANTSYTYRVKARDSASTPNETGYSTSSTTATQIETPAGISFGEVTASSIVLNATGTLSNLTAGSSGLFFDSTTSGGDTGINVWIQATTDTATSLSPNTTYTFQVKARNRNSIETGWSPTASKTTLANVPGAPTLSNVTVHALNLDVNPNANPAATQFAVRCAATVDPTWNGKYVDATGNPSASAVWRTDAQWGSITVQNLDAATQYCFDVKARNADLLETGFSSQSCATTQTGIVRGDLNCDGANNAFDIDPFVLALTDPAAYAAAYPNCNILNADINCDGTVNAFDIDGFVQCLTTGCPACP